MKIIICIFWVLAYVVICTFVASLFTDEDIVLWAIFWPVVLLCTFPVRLIDLAKNAGTAIRKFLMR